MPHPENSSSSLYVYIVLTPSYSESPNGSLPEFGGKDILREMQETNVVIPPHLRGLIDKGSGLGKGSASTIVAAPAVAI